MAKEQTDTANRGMSAEEVAAKEANEKAVADKTAKDAVEKEAAEKDAAEKSGKPAKKAEALDLKKIGKQFMNDNKDHKLVYVAGDGTVFPGTSEGKNNAMNHQGRGLGLDLTKIEEVKKD